MFKPLQRTCDVSTASAIAAWSAPSPTPSCVTCSLAEGAPTNYSAAPGVAWAMGTDTYAFTCNPGYFGPAVQATCLSTMLSSPWGPASPQPNCQQCSLSDALAYAPGLAGVAALPSSAWSATWTYAFRCAAGTFGPAVPWTCDSTSGSWTGSALSCVSCASSLYQAIPATDGFVGPTTGTFVLDAQGVACDSCFVCPCTCACLDLCLPRTSLQSRPRHLAIPVPSAGVVLQLSFRVTKRLGYLLDMRYLRAFRLKPLHRRRLAVKRLLSHSLLRLRRRRGLRRQSLTIRMTAQLHSAQGLRYYRLYDMA